MVNVRSTAASLAAAATIAGLLSPLAGQAQTLKAVMNSDLKIVDPIWTTAYVQRGFGYMVWDTLFALDDKLQVQPEMVDRWEVSPDRLSWTFTLRDGLVWSDGAPVTSEDCIPSIKRWGARDSMGQKMMASVTGFEAVDARTFRMKMKEPYGLVLESLGKPSANVPFMMPKRVAETDPFTQIKADEVIGSGGSDVGMADVLNAKAAKARQLLQEAGYDGTPVELLQSTDLTVLTNRAPVAKAQLEAAGIKVNIQSMDWQTLVVRRTKKDPPDKGGWNMFITSWGAADILNPVSAAFFNASCDKALFGWPCDETIEKLRDQFAKEADPAKQKQIALDLQKYWVGHPTHVHLGQWYQPIALRADIEGMMVAPATAFWNMSRKK